MASAGELLKTPTRSLKASWFVHALEWASLLPVLSVCSWVILNVG
jgi:hypothetical protein